MVKSSGSYSYVYKSRYLLKVIYTEEMTEEELKDLIKYRDKIWEDRK
jgi:hypothetical protein